MKRRFTLDGRDLSISLEPDFWQELEKIALTQGSSLDDLVARVYRVSWTSGTESIRVVLASKLRLFVLRTLRAERQWLVL